MRFHRLTTALAGVLLVAIRVHTANAESKPISADCAKACVKAGSPLVILADNGSVYWPTSDAMPPTGQNEELLPFAAQKVVVSGKLYERGGSKALLIEKVEAAK